MKTFDVQAREVRVYESMRMREKRGRLCMHVRVELEARDQIDVVLRTLSSVRNMSWLWLICSQMI